MIIILCFTEDEVLKLHTASKMGLAGALVFIKSPIDYFTTIM